MASLLVKSVDVRIVGSIGVSRQVVAFFVLPMFVGTNSVAHGSDCSSFRQVFAANWLNGTPLFSCLCGVALIDYPLPQPLVINV